MFDDDVDVNDDEEQYDDGTLYHWYIDIMTHKHTEALALYHVSICRH